MSLFLYKLYRRLFGGRRFFRLNRFLFQCALNGMGFFICESGENGESFFLSKFLREKTSNVVFDVGANVGKYSAEVFKISPNSTVYAFEPHPETFKKLSAAIHSARFYPQNIAVGKEPGKLPLYDYQDGDGSSHASLFQTVIEDFRGQKSVCHQVAVITLSDFLKENNILSVDLLKIDTEGNEMSVIQGALDFLRYGTIRAIQFEFNEMNVASRTFFLDFWKALPGYYFYRILPDGLVHMPSYSSTFCEIFAFQNIVALAKADPINQKILREIA